MENIKINDGKILVDDFDCGNVKDYWDLIYTYGFEYVLGQIFKSINDGIKINKLVE
jgi:hypothetical protein